MNRYENITKNQQSHSDVPPRTTLLGKRPLFWLTRTDKPQKLWGDGGVILHVLFLKLIVTVLVNSSPTISGRNGSSVLKILRWTEVHKVLLRFFLSIKTDTIALSGFALKIDDLFFEISEIFLFDFDV